MKAAITAFASLACLVSLGAAAQAAPAKTHYTATLIGKDEVPSNMTAGTGKLDADLDTTTNTLTYTATYSGLTGPATMAHFHGPAAPGTNAPPVIVVKDPASPIKGMQVLTADQEAALADGKWYFNVHTKAHPGGEIRGQVLAQ